MISIKNAFFVQTWKEQNSEPKQHFNPQQLAAELSHSSKTCHLVVDRAGERKLNSPDLDASNLPAHELGALFVLGNQRKRLKSGKVWFGES